MSQYQLTSNAKDDLLVILDYISGNNPVAADRVEASILESCDFLAKTPYAGHFRTDLTHRPVRFWAVPRYSNYLIVYDPGFQSLGICSHKLSVLNASTPRCVYLVRELIPFLLGRLAGPKSTGWLNL